MPAMKIVKDKADDNLIGKEIHEVKVYSPIRVEPIKEVEINKLNHSVEKADKVFDNDDDKHITLEGKSLN